MGRRGVRTAFMAIGLLGVLLCAVSGLARLAGHYTVAGIGAQSVMVAGIALLALAIFGKAFFVDE